MPRLCCVLPSLLLITTSVVQAQEPASQTTQLAAAFREYSGAEIVFEHSALPPGVYHDLMVPLSADRHPAALKIALGEVRKLPKRFLQNVGIKAIGVFASCASRQGDGFRPYDKELKGYRYFGIYNGQNAVAAAYYTDEQLPLTFHHEIFHHIDALTDPPIQPDRRLAQILSGENLYPAPRIKPADLAALKKISHGQVLDGAVSEYAQKNPAEDKAETARYLMSTLADSLVQITEQPALAGSQRILHVLEKYRQSLGGKGPTVDWFVDVALNRQDSAVPQPDGETAETDAHALTAQLQSFGEGDARISEQSARLLLQHALKSATAPIDAAAAESLALASAAATQQLLKTQIRPDDSDRKFVVLGSEDADGVNWTLRENISAYGHDAIRLASIAAAAPETSELILRTQLQNLRLLSRFYVYVAASWQVTEKTQQAFEGARNHFAAALANDDPRLATRIARTDLASLAERITPEGSLQLFDNRYLKNVDAEIKDPELRWIIREVQPACVRLGGGSGVCISPQGHILTAAHVADHLQSKVAAEFPDGSNFVAACIAIDNDLDLAICSVPAKRRLPFALVANAPPAKGATVVCIGQPGTTTPDGKPTGYEPFNVSIGAIRGFLGDPLGTQRLGRTKHDAWTYWGHSGSPLFDDRGQIVALHNSWDPSTTMRHAVTQQAIAKFVRDNGLGKSIAGKQ